MLIIAVLVLETLKLVLTILALLFELGGIAFNTQEMVELFPDEKPSRPLNNHCVYQKNQYENTKERPSRSWWRSLNTVGAVPKRESASFPGVQERVVPSVEVRAALFSSLLRIVSVSHHNL